MKKEYDPTIDAAYIYLTEKTTHVADSGEISDGVLVDYDANGRPVGIEILNASDILPTKVLHYLKRDPKATV